ncbi:hypothetical protein [Lacinutrix undariae]
MTRKIIVFLVLAMYSLQASSQCAMCRAVLESEEGLSTAKGINDGIVYLMAIPYILAAGLGCIIYFKYFRTDSHKN